MAFQKLQSRLPEALTIPKPNPKVCPTIKSARTWPNFPCSLWFETHAKAHVICVNCPFEEKRDWHGKIVGHGIHGFLNAFFTMIKYKNKATKMDSPLMVLIHTCAQCYHCYEDQSGHNDALQVDRIIKTTPGGLILQLSYKAVEEVVGSRQIVMEGVLMNTVKTIGADGQEKEWYMSKALF
jgi:hypothetical protein